MKARGKSKERLGVYVYVSGGEMLYREVSLYRYVCVSVVLFH